MRIDHASTWLRIILIVALVLPLKACVNHKGSQDLHKEVGFRFGIRDDTTGVEDFIAVTVDKDLIATARGQLLLEVSERTLHIHGLIAEGDGGHNLNWPWHFLPSEWTLVEESTEICDSRPSAVHIWIENLPDTLTSIPFCPLSSYVKAETPQ